MKQEINQLVTAIKNSEEYLRMQRAKRKLDEFPDLKRQVNEFRVRAYQLNKEGAPDLFEMMERGMVAKIRIMEQYPHVAQFAIRAFYEKNEAVRPEVQRSYRKKVTAGASGALARLDPEDFRPGLDLEMMCREMYWASEGYLWEMVQ